MVGGLTSMRGILKGGRAAIDRARTAKDLNKSKVAANPIENGVTLKPKTGDKVSMNTKAGTTVESGEVKISKDVAEKIAAEKDAAKRRAMIENEVKKNVGDAEWNKMTQREKNDFLSKFESATDGVDFNMPIKGRRLSPSNRGAQFDVAESVNGPQKRAGWQAFWDPRKVRIEDVARKYTDVSEMPEYVKRYLKQEYGKNAALGYGMFHGTPNGKFLGLPGRLGRIGSKHNAQDFNQENLPWRLENNKLKWWQNFGPNRKYSLVNVPKSQVSQQVQSITSLPKPSRQLKQLQQDIFNVGNRRFGVYQDQRNISKRHVADVLDRDFKIKNANKKISIENYIDNLRKDPRVKRAENIMKKKTGSDLKDLYSKMKQKNNHLSDTELWNLMLQYFVRYGKSGMKIPKYQEPAGELPEYPGSIPT